MTDNEIHWIKKRSCLPSDFVCSLVHLSHPCQSGGNRGERESFTNNYICNNRNIPAHRLKNVLLCMENRHCFNYTEKEIDKPPELSG